jgi:hypothetical protein
MNKEQLQVLLMESLVLLKVVLNTITLTHHIYLGLTIFSTTKITLVDS